MRSLTRLAIAVICLIASPLRGSDAPDALPFRLDNGSMLDWAWANYSPCAVTIVVQTTNSTGGLNTCGMFKDGLSFVSCGDFQSYAVNNGMRLFNLLRDQTSTHVHFRLEATYAGLNAQGAVAQCVDTDLGQAASIANCSFSAMLTGQSVSLPIVLPIAGVTNASIRFGNCPDIPLGLAANGIAFSGSFATNSGRARLSVTFDNGESAVYTQSGNQILPPIVSVANADCSSNLCLSVLASAGADTTIQSSTNYIDWIVIGAIPWDSVVTEAVITIPTTNLPIGFFRAYSN